MKNVKIVLAFLLINFLSGKLFAQAPVIQWQKNYGGTHDEEAYSISIMSDGSFAIVGYACSSNGDVTNHKPSTPGFLDPDIWLLKIDSLSNIIWNKCYGGTYEEIGKSVIETIDNGFIVTGRTNSDDGDIIGIHSYADDLWVVKVDSIGTFEWQKCLGGSESEIGNQIIQTKDSGYLVVGTSDSYNGDLHGFHGSDDIWIIKLNSNGVKKWTKCLGGTSGDYGYSCKETKDGGFLILGSTNSNDWDVGGQHNFMSPDIWVVKIDSVGKLIWQRCYGGISFDGPAQILLTNDGGAFITGYTSSSDGDVTDLIGIFDYWLIKIDSTGNILWQKCYGGTTDETTTAASLTFDGGIVMVGVAWDDDSMVTGTHGYTDYWVCKVDSLGNFEWGKALGGSGEEYPFSIEETHDRGYLLAGSTKSLHTGDVTNNHGGKDFWIVKLAPIGLSVPETENTLMELTVFQNNDRLNLKFFSKKNENAQLCLYDVNGKKVFDKNILINEGINYNSFNCSGLTMGMYFVKIDCEKGSLSGKIILQSEL